MTEADHETVRSGLETHLPRLWRYGLSLSRNPSVAEELVQATCLRALERQSQFRTGTNLRAWLFTILSSIWKNQLRAEKVRTGGGFADPETELVFDGAASMETNNLLRRVLSEVSELPEAQRQAVILVYVEEFTYREAAHILEVPIGTIMSRLSAARGKLAGLDSSATNARKTRADEVGKN
ncbi:MAG: RNA polymerase sigma factor [Minwuia sp.]|nr:RNA polymerase sigma factor [Minwuia sp.]